MASLNERNQQILGILSLTSGAARMAGLLGASQKASDKLRDKPNSAGKVIEQARAGIRKWGIEKPALTYVGITPPKLLKSNLADAETIVQTLVALRAERVQTPGLALGLSTSRRYGVGPVEKLPHTVTFTDVNVSFIGDARGVIHQFFYAWMKSIIGFHDVPRQGAATDTLYKKYQPYEIGYRQDYSTNVDIITYDEIQEKIGTVRLYNAYPIAIGEIGRSWDSVNDLVRIPVTFTFTHWNYVDELNVKLVEPNRSSLAQQNSSLISNLITGMSAIQAISAIKRPQNVNDILNVVNTGSTLLKSYFGNPINY